MSCGGSLRGERTPIAVMQRRVCQSTCRDPRQPGQAGSFDLSRTWMSRALSQRRSPAAFANKGRGPKFVALGQYRSRAARGLRRGIRRPRDCPRTNRHVPCRRARRKVPRPCGIDAERWNDTPQGVYTRLVPDQCADAQAGESVALGKCPPDHEVLDPLNRAFGDKAGATEVCVCLIHEYDRLRCRGGDRHDAIAGNDDAGRVVRISKKDDACAAFDRCEHLWVGRANITMGIFTRSPAASAQAAYMSNAGT